MKKLSLLGMLLVCTLLVACGEQSTIPEVEEKENVIDNDVIYSTIEYAIAENESPKYYKWEKMFVSFDVLWTWKSLDRNTEYYLNVQWEIFYIDDNGNLNNGGWFGVPMTVEVAENNDWYKVVNLTQAQDWSYYTSSIKEMFSNEAYKRFEDGIIIDSYNTDKSLLEYAEEYFNITIIPETKQDFICDFCDKVRYETDVNEFIENTWNIWYHVSLTPTENKTFLFKTDWLFETTWSRDAWEWTRVFGKDDKTVIVLMNDIQHVYDRYNIIEKSEDDMIFSLDIIQKS